MSDRRLYVWEFERNPWDSRADATTFSVGIFQWVPKASGAGLKKSNTIRVLGFTADPKAVYAQAVKLCHRLNEAKVRSGSLPDWVQKQYSVPRPAALNKTTVKDRVTAMARDVWEPELRKLGFRRTRRSFWRNNAKVCHVVQLSMSRWGTSSQGSFDVELGVFWHEVEEMLKNPCRGKMPPLEYQCTYRVNLGGLLPEEHQKSWDVNLETDMQTLGRDVLAEFICHGLPWLEFRSELKHTQNITRYLRQTGPKVYSSPEMGVGWASVIFMVMLGKINKAKQKLESWLNGTPSDAGVFALADRLNIDLSDAGSDWGKTHRAKIGKRKRVHKK